MVPQRPDIQRAPSLTFRVHLGIASFEQRLTGTCETASPLWDVPRTANPGKRSHRPPFLSPPSGSVTWKCLPYASLSLLEAPCDLGTEVQSKTSAASSCMSAETEGNLAHRQSRTHLRCMSVPRNIASRTGPPEEPRTGTQAERSSSGKWELLPQALHTAQERCSQPEAVATRLECRPCSCRCLSWSSSQVQSEKWAPAGCTGAGAATTGAGVAVMMPGMVDHMTSSQQSDPDILSKPRKVHVQALLTRDLTQWRTAGLGQGVAQWWHGHRGHARCGSCHWCCSLDRSRCCADGWKARGIRQRRSVEPPRHSHVDHR